MTHTSPEREELRKEFYTLLTAWGVHEGIAAGVSREMLARGYRRLPIDQARVGEIRERHERTENLAAQGIVLGLTEKRIHKDRAYLLSLLEDTKEGAAPRGPAEQDEKAAFANAFQNGFAIWSSPNGRVFRTINEQPIRWTDKQGFVHAVEGADVHPAVRLLWTLCERDVPANTAVLSAEAPTCATCKVRAHAVAQSPQVPLQEKKP